MGASALVISLNDDAVLKVPRVEKGAIEAQAREQRIFEILEHERSPYLIACIYRVPGATFLPRMSSNFKDIIKAGVMGRRTFTVGRGSYVVVLPSWSGTVLVIAIFGQLPWRPEDPDASSAAVSTTLTKRSVRSRMSFIETPLRGMAATRSNSAARASLILMLPTGEPAPCNSNFTSLERACGSSLR